MAIDYNTLLGQMINSPFSTPADRERMVKLLLSEKEKKYVTEEQVIDLINLKLGINKGGENGSEKGVNRNYIPPDYLSDFLYEYNQDPVLKYTCHTIDSSDVIEKICLQCQTSNYVFSAHQQLILKHYLDLETKHKNIDYKLKSLIYTYITGLRYGTQEKNKWAGVFDDGWGSENIKEWAKKNPNLVPNPGPNIKQKYQYSGGTLSKKYLSPLNQKRVMGFDGLVLCFKSLFHIKQDNNLEDILSVAEQKIKDEYPNIVFSREDFHKEIELFTNVLNIKKAYEKIVRLCINSGGGKNIITSFNYNRQGEKCLIIKDDTSVYGKSIDDTVERLGEATTDIINNQINGTCNLYIEADFPDGNSYLVNLWNGNNRAKIQIDPVGGVKYILEFKKRKS